MNEVASAPAVELHHGLEQAVSLEHFGIGTMLNIENIAQPQAPRLGARVIGLARGQSIIAVPRGATTLPGSLHPGDDIHVRCLLQRAACGFRSRVLHLSRTPYPHFHLAYPEEVQTRDVRSAERAVVSITGAVSGGGERQAAVEIVDLSAEGARIVGPVELGAVDQSFELSFDLSFGDVTRSFRLRGLIRNVAVLKAGEGAEALCRYGVHFEGLDEFDRVLLRGFVFEQLVYHEAEQREALSSG